MTQKKKDLIVTLGLISFLPVALWGLATSSMQPKSASVSKTDRLPTSLIVKFKKQVNLKNINAQVSIQSAGLQFDITRLLPKNAKIQSLYKFGKDITASNVNNAGLNRVSVISGIPKDSIVSTKIALEKNRNIEWVNMNYSVNLQDKMRIANGKGCDASWSYDRMGVNVVQSVFNNDNSYPHYTGNGIVIAMLGNPLIVNSRTYKNKLWTNTKELNGRPGIDDDKNGYIDDIHGYNHYYDNGNVGLPENVSQDRLHESYMTSILVGEDVYGTSYHGVAPNARVMVSSMVSEYGMTLASVLSSHYYAIMNGADIINDSWDFAKTDVCTLESVSDMLNFADRSNVLVVASSGNAGGLAVCYPAGHPSVLTVGATNNQHKRAYFSNYGKNVDVSAPGEGTYVELENNFSSTRVCISGTSGSAAYVSGFAALLMEKYPSYSIEQIRQIIKKSVRKIESDKYIGSGEIFMPAFLMYDVSRDGKISILDLTIVSSNYGKPSGLFDVRADVNKDGRVSIHDLTAVSTWYGK